MRLYLIFTVLNLQLIHIFAFPPNPLESSSLDRRYLEGYECGNVFFYDSEVKEALSIAIPSINKGHQFPQKYRGKLYIESRFEEYYLYPIRNGLQLPPYQKRAKTVFYIVFTESSNEELDVIAKVTTSDYTKCIRRYRTSLGPLNLVPENTNGFLCAHKFFTDEIIHQSLALAQTKVEGNPKYPSSYPGNLYPQESGHLIWPIMKGESLYSSGNCNYLGSLSFHSRNRH